MRLFEGIVGIGMLLFAIGFNLWLYRLEPTVTIDPNDNLFQYALVARTNEIWDFAQKQCGLNPLCFTGYLIDHWVPNWAQGYNLPFYYSHVPQITIVASYRLLNFIRGPLAVLQEDLLQNSISLFQYYHWVIYLLLSFFPLSIFAALRVIRLPWLVAGIGALLASHISTDGLYGLDPPSFLWRGYGLSSQLFAMIFMPIAIAYFWKYVSVHTNHASLAILFTILTTMGHLGMGIITLLSMGIMAVAGPAKELLGRLGRLGILGGSTLVLLSYWIVPIFLSSDYHNISFWDPVWKFNSYPWKETMTRLFNGELFDFGRLPILTALILIGIFAEKGPFSILFLGWLLLYFGRTTWGPLIDIIPGMKEFHLSRFIVGLHLAGIFLAPIGVVGVVREVRGKVIRLLCYLVIGILVIFMLYPQTIRYAQHNDTLIKQANENFDRVKPDIDALFTTLKNLPPGRVYFGRGGSWGKDFKVAETPMFIYASSMGFPGILWLPETWSPSSDVEQYFVEENPAHYDLFNLKYVVAPPDVKPQALPAGRQAFWKLSSEGKTWKLYTVETSGYFTTGTLAATVTSDKDDFKNVVRLWLQSDYPKDKLFAELRFAPLSSTYSSSLPAFNMTNESTYQTRDGKTFSLFGNVPVYEGQKQTSVLRHQSSDSDMIFKTSVSVGEKCSQCLLILKQTFHPNWKAYVDGKRVETMTVFPFLTAIRLDRPGDYSVEFRYEPSGLKKILLIITLTLTVGILFYRLVLAKKTRDTKAAQYNQII